MRHVEMVRGLSEIEVEARRERGEGNNASFTTSRSYADIIRANVFTFLNGILVSIGGMLVAVGRIGDAVIAVGPLFLANAVIRTGQEIYAKRRLDRISLAGRPTVTVIRDGQEKAINPTLLVRGDLLRVRAGDQVMADGTVLGEGRLEMDESLLSGEPELVSKRAGDTLLSGSFCIAGEGLYSAEKVGAASFANELTIAARKFEVETTPLQSKINITVRVIIAVVALMSLFILLGAILQDLPFVRLVQISAVLTAQVPYGLFFMTVIAYALGAVAVAGSGAIVQQASAIESLSSIDVLCLDKTGSLTANRLRYRGLQPLSGASKDEVERLLGDFASSVSSPNRTTEAILAGVDGKIRTPVDEVPFASSRQWSAIAFGRDGGEQDGTFVLGALDAVAPNLSAEIKDAVESLPEQVRVLSRQGLRVLVFAHSQSIALHDDMARPRLPALTPLALISLSDELRPEARETIAEFTRLGIEIKVVSGDDPDTVLAIARQAGLAGELEAASGLDLARMSEGEFGEAVARATVFGRIAPQQKEKLVAALIVRGHHVAMLGDGTNDVLAVKNAQLGIAMESGSDATRNVADIILLNDSFAALRPAFDEGKRIVAGVTMAMYLYLTRVTIATLVIIAIAVLGLGFPFEPAQEALTYLAAGIPSLFLIWWARPESAEAEFFRSLARFVLPAAIVTTLIGVALYVAYYFRVLNGIQTYQIPPHIVDIFRLYTGVKTEANAELAPAAATIVAQTALSTFITVTPFLLILFLRPPIRIFTGWTQMSQDKRPVFLALGLFAILVAVIVIPEVQYYFGLFKLGPGEPAILGAAVVAWAFALRTIWRTKLMDRLLALDAPH
jgi:cation-transporting ATPase E